MCLYPKLIKNPKYKSNKKNGGVVPAVHDPRVLYVPIACGKCMECCKAKAREWQIRLLEDIKTNKNGKFITLTFSNESIKKICKLEEVKATEGYDKDNKIATIAVRMFLERWRKKYSKSVRHWLITELGHNGTENVHLHGIIFTNESYNTIKDLWNYGYIWPRDNTTKTWVDNKTINYITKYVTKIDIQHKYYKPKILTSPGIGHAYTDNNRSKINKFNETETIETYRTESGHKIALPIYYRNKLYTDEEKEKLWLQKLDKNERWVGGEKIKADNTDEYFGLLKHYRALNTQLGYNDDSKNWEIIEYEKHRREIMIHKRTQEINDHGYPEDWDK